MTDYRYIFGTLGGEQVIEEIPCYGVSMDMQMNKGGQWQGTFQLDQTGKQNVDLIGASIPGRCWVAAERNGQPIWVGYIWSRVYSAQSKTVQLFANSFERYPTKRLVRQNTAFISPTEQRNIFRFLWQQMQADVGNANLNVNVPGSFVDANLKTLSVLATDFKYYDQMMSSLSDAVDGFDWYIAVSKDGTYYRKDLLIGYPTLGSQASDGMPVFEYPGNITQYYLTENMQDAGTFVYVVGGGEGDDMITSESIATSLVATGFPRWDTVISRKDLNTQAAVTGMGQQLLANLSPPVAVNKITLKANLVPEFGSYSLGDKCKIVIQDPRWPGVGYTGTKRLLKWSLTPQSSDSTEEVSLVFEGDPDV